jgi:hypothetical protein
VTSRTPVVRVDFKEDFPIRNADLVFPQVVQNSRSAYAVVIRPDPSICQADIAGLQNVYRGVSRNGMCNQKDQRPMECGMTRDFGSNDTVAKRELSYLTETGLKRLLNFRGRGMLQLRSDTVGKACCCLNSSCI